MGDTDVHIGSCTEYDFLSLSGGAVMVNTEDGGLQDGNTGNGGAIGQVLEVNNDGNPNEVGLESVMKESPPSYAIRSSYARILIEIDASNCFSDNLVMDVPNLDEPRYTKETIRVKY
ncbi:hypothetical protein Tco_1042303 [Tanacetum coccineum]|uniref:Uncharacterized protein n=1 Tax=Tanacetum coccineum TaxID=301880 RepID=A0ABQ5GLC4_9ASTR